MGTDGEHWVVPGTVIKLAWVGGLTDVVAAVVVLGLTVGWVATTVVLGGTESPRVSAAGGTSVTDGEVAKGSGHGGVCRRTERSGGEAAVPRPRVIAGTERSGRWGGVRGEAAARQHRAARVGHTTSPVVVALAVVATSVGVDHTTNVLLIVLGVVLKSFDHTTDVLLVVLALDTTAVWREGRMVVVTRAVVAPLGDAEAHGGGTRRSGG